MENRRWACLASIALTLAILLSGCADNATPRVNGDAWRHGFGYPGPGYPDTGH
ncbi:hypothetical protein [Bordetella sp. H567]|uniref:hypothetical protein n=1 Tax=Bordetella sp. H567 TaxID=1697043 RepID=UPI0013142334|nr:hypothetical protein [Bordetella sp. H567]